MMKKNPPLQLLSESRKERILRWEIPHLLSVLKKEHGLSFMHLLPSLPLYFEGHLVFEGKTCFPVQGGALGHLLCFRALNKEKARQIRAFVDARLQKFFKALPLKTGALPLKTGALPPKDELSHRSLLNGALPPKDELSHRSLLNGVLPPKAELSHRSLLNGALPLKNGVLPPLCFPLLLKGGAKSALLKTAHDIYLKTPSFAFLNAEDMIWKKNVFQELQQVFVCVPSFYALSPVQKRILIKALSQKKLSCYLTVGLGEKESLPEKWRALFARAL